MKLYKKDTKGKTRYLDVYNDGVEVVQISGVIGTDSPVEHRKVAKPKNVGKSNETTAERQAELEAKAIIADKLTKGYFKSIDELKNAVVILPMLAKEYKKESRKIDWASNDVYIQPKLDGMRCLLHINSEGIQMISRDGKTISTMHHIEVGVSQLTDGYHIILDGELYAHGKTFQENMELIKKIRPETPLIKFHCYDMVMNKGVLLNEMNFISRYQNMVSIVENYSTVIEVVPTIKITSEEKLINIHQNFVGEGYEGTMVRHGKDGYKINGRSSSLLKYKDFIDDALKIIDVVPAVQRPEWGVPVVDYKGKRVECGTKLSHEQRKEILSNKEHYIGLTGEIRHFGETDGGSLRFPILHGFRLDK